MCHRDGIMDQGGLCLMGLGWAFALQPQKDLRCECCPL